MGKSTWIKNGKKITGSCSYNRARDQFYVWLDYKEPISGKQLEFWSGDPDHPNFNGWKLLEEKDQSDRNKRRN